MHVRRRSGVLFQTLGTPLHTHFSFAAAKKGMFFIYSVHNAAVLAQAVQVC